MLSGVISRGDPPRMVEFWTLLICLMNGESSSHHLSPIDIDTFPLFSLKNIFLAFLLLFYVFLAKKKCFVYIKHIDSFVDSLVEIISHIPLYSLAF